MHDICVNFRCTSIYVGHFHLVRMLINEYGADIHVPTLLARQSPLHLAVGKGLRQIASILLTHGADLHARDSKGCWYGLPPRYASLIAAT